MFESELYRTYKGTFKQYSISWNLVRQEASYYAQVRDSWWQQQFDLVRIQLQRVRKLSDIIVI